MKESFNIGLVELEGSTVLKNSICDNIFGHYNVFSPDTKLIPFLPPFFRCFSPCNVVFVRMIKLFPS